MKMAKIGRMEAIYGPAAATGFSPGFQPWNLCPKGTAGLSPGFQPWEAAFPGTRPEGTQECPTQEDVC
jgi:hypothetical protein